MNVLISCEQHFDRSPDGSVWTDGQFPYRFWTRYLSVFDSVRVFARMRHLTVTPEGFQRADGDRVSFLDAPDYAGPQQYLWRMAKVSAAAARALDGAEAMILRAPGLTGRCLESQDRGAGRPYAVEVVADPHDVFSPGAVRHPLRFFFRWWFARTLRRQCVRACAAAYVTRGALQRRYPPASRAYSTYYSDVELPKEAFLKAPRGAGPNGVARLVFVGTLAQLYKAPDVLIDAVNVCAGQGAAFELVIIGSGKHRAELEMRATAAGLGSRVRFLGQLTTAEAVRSELDRADLFVLPSRQEGLPRAMVEAMARALPCIGSTVGGIPELLDSDDLVPPNDVPALARKIRETTADPARMARMSARNLARAREYCPEALCQRREAFYQSVREQTEAWRRGLKPPS
jgi:glycosyltransferase involved in cell wall biosynthesis